MSSTVKSSLGKALNKFEKTIKRNMDSKHKKIMEKWLNTWCYYISHEKGFKPHENIKYNAGDVITVCYGYNVGSEQGGNRPSVVIEDNDLSDKNVMVIPLSLLFPYEMEKDIHFKNAYLGELTDFNTASGNPKGTRSKALINQMRSVSKQRIIRPTKKEDIVITIESDKLKAIYNKITELYTTKGLEKEIQVNDENVK